MTDAQIQDIYARLDSLTEEVNSLKTQIGVVGTTQYAVVQILDRLERVETTQAQHTQSLAQHTQLLNQHTQLLNQHTQSLNQHTQSLNQHTQSLNQHTQLLNEILQILRDRNGGSGI